MQISCQSASTHANCQPAAAKKKGRHTMTCVPALFLLAYGRLCYLTMSLRMAFSCSPLKRTK